MDGGMGYFVIMLIQTVVFLVPVLLLAYRQGKRDQLVDEIMKDLNGLGEKVSKTRDEHILTLSEIKAQIGNMNETLIRVTTQMEYFTKAIEEMKKQ